MIEIKRPIFVVCAMAGVGALVGAWLDPSNFFRAYLFTLLFCLGLSLGSLANLMLHEVSGGRWGIALRAPLIAAARLLPLIALLFVPLFFGLKFIYPWATEHSVDIAAKSWWLDPAFFIVRAAVYFLIWLALSLRWLHIARSATSARPPALRRLSAIGLIVYGLTASLASIDWIMSLLPQWYSTAFGLIVVTSQMLAGMALGVTACAYITHKRDAEEICNDLGNLLLMYAMTWMYLTFTQFLIIWAEDLPHEIAWYLPRLQTSWRWLTGVVVVLQFCLPFMLLLFRKIKRVPHRLGAVAVGFLCAQLLFVFYLVTPTLKPSGFTLVWSDILVPIALVPLYLVLWRVNLQSTLREGGNYLSASEEHPVAVT